MQDEDIAPLFKQQGTEEDPLSKALKGVGDDYGKRVEIDQITGEPYIEGITR